MEERPEYKSLVNDVKKLRGDVDSVEKAFINKKDQFNLLNEHVKTLEEHLGLLLTPLKTEAASEIKEEIKEINDELKEVVEKIEENNPISHAVETNLENKLDTDIQKANTIEATITKELKETKQEDTITNKSKEELWELLLQLVGKVKIVLNTPNAEYFKAFNYNKERTWGTFLKHLTFGPKTSEFLDAYKKVSEKINKNTYYNELKNSNKDDEKEEFEFINKLKSEIDGLYKEYTGFLGKRFGYGGMRKTKKTKRNGRKRKTHRA